MDQPPPPTIQTLRIMAMHVATSRRDVLNHAAEFERQQLRDKEHRRIAKRKRDEYDLAILAAAVPAFSGSIRRFWVDVRSGEWNTLLLNGLMLQEKQFEKTFRMSRDSFDVLHGLLGTHHNHCRL
jgi:hypothetical protein